MKKIVALFLTLTCLIMLMIPVLLQTSALTEFSYEYEVDSSTNYATIVNRSTAVAGDEFIPSLLGEYVVTAIGDEAFYYCDDITRIVIPDTVSRIGQAAFAECTGMKSITIPSTVTSIGKFAFSNCRSLTTVVLPDGVTYISDGMFSDCSSLTAFSVADSVTGIGDRAFFNCTDLVSITIPDSVTSIGSLAFAFCENLTINGYAGSYAEKYASENGIPFRSLEAESQNENDYTYTITDGKATITGVQPSLSGDVVIPAVLGGYPVTAIGEKAFLNHQKITGITIPKGVTTIGYEAFFACTGLVSVRLPDSLTVIEDWAFSGCALTDVAIPSGVTRIGDAAFADCYSLNNIALPADVTDIGQWAFLNTAYYNDTKNWVDSTLYIGRCLVEANKHINGDYTVKPGTTAIADYAFSDRAGLTGITIPDSVVNIGVDAFYYCDLLDITVDENNAHYRSVDGVLFDKDMTTLLVYPSQKKDTTYIVPESVAVIADHAFHRSFVSEITLPDELTDIGSRAFFNCYSLTEITIPGSVSTLGEQAFMMSGLKSVVIENGLTHIDRYAFGLLEDITIPPSVIDIHVEAFWGPDEDSLLIYGESGSYAQTFAQDNGIAFKDVNDPPQPLGDVNSDDEINAMDATRVLLASVEKVTLLQRQSLVADVNGDGRVNTVDAARILLHTVGKKLIKA